MERTLAAQKRLSKYIKDHCPASRGGASGHLSPLIKSIRMIGARRQSKLRRDTSGNTSNFAMTNKASMSSFSGASTIGTDAAQWFSPFPGDGVDDNTSPTGAEHMFVKPSRGPRPEYANHEESSWHHSRGGCSTNTTGSRRTRLSSLPGEYHASGEWGRSTLLLKADGSAIQTTQFSDDQTVITSRGRWETRGRDYADQDISLMPFVGLGPRPTAFLLG